MSWLQKLEMRSQKEKKNKGYAKKTSFVNPILTFITSR